jgi:predicted site-specific integrase-resolvase
MVGHRLLRLCAKFLNYAQKACPLFAGVYSVHKLGAKVEVDMAPFGYARVSSDGQSLTAQVAELKAANCERIYKEKISGARSDRKQLAKLIAGLGKGDILVVN